MKIAVNVSYASESIKIDPSSFAFEANVESGENNLLSMIDQMVAARDQSIAFIEQIAKAQRAAQPQSANNNNRKKKTEDEDDDEANDDDNEEMGNEEQENVEDINSPQKKKQKL